MKTISQNQELLKHLFELIEAHRGIFNQKRIYNRVVALIFAEIFVFARHTMTQILMTLGLVEQDWSAMYRIFSERRFKYAKGKSVV